jgi:hypothetical protein
LTPSEQLVTALAETARALESGDTEAASTAMQRVVSLCDEARTAGLLLEPAVLEEAKCLLEKCASTAAAVQLRLLGEMSHAGLGRRAAAAYRRR